MRRPKRSYLVKRISELVGLPPGKETEDYFTRRQLAELLIWIRHAVDQLERFEEAGISTNLVNGSTINDGSEKDESPGED